VSAREGHLIGTRGDDVQHEGFVLLEIENAACPQLLKALHSGPLGQVRDIGKAHETGGFLFLHLSERRWLSDGGRGRGGDVGLVIDLRAIAVLRVWREERGLLLIVGLSFADCE
jgi:hypothetical protein